jgi:hypothetical protein
MFRTPGCRLHPNRHRSRQRAIHEDLAHHRDSALLARDITAGQVVACLRCCRSGPWSAPWRCAGQARPTSHSFGSMWPRFSTTLNVLPPGRAMYMFIRTWC